MRELAEPAHSHSVVLDYLGGRHTRDYAGRNSPLAMFLGMRHSGLAEGSVSCGWVALPSLGFTEVCLDARAVVGGSFLGSRWLNPYARKCLNCGLKRWSSAVSDSN